MSVTIRLMLMKQVKARRLTLKISQRGLAKMAGVSFRTVQLLEWGRHDWRLSTMEKIAHALGLPRRAIEQSVDRCLGREIDSIADISERIFLEGAASWSIHVFNFVDEFRRNSRPDLIAVPPAPETPKQLKCLIASTVESLCDERGMPTPDWCLSVGRLSDPWFVSGIESLKAYALVHSPVHFRKRNIFVMDNFLNRA